MPEPCRSSPNAPQLSLPAWEPTPRHEAEATVLAQRAIVGHEFEIVLYAPQVAQSARPGQFVEILFGENYAPLVRRPFSLYRVDRAAGTFSVLYLARGAFTSGLARKREGDAVSLLGPLGRPFHYTDDRAVQHILVAGGLGAPPLYFLASELVRALPARTRGSRKRDDSSGQKEISLTTRADNTLGSPAGAAALLAGSRAMEDLAADRLIVINAARTESLLVGLTEFGELDVALHVMTDDGSRGIRGMATDLLAALLEAQAHRNNSTVVYACGPMPMLRSVGEIAIDRGVPCQLSIETTMPCGIGLCQGCATPVRDPAASSGFRYALACVDGPVFEARDILWPDSNRPPLPTP